MATRYRNSSGQWCTRKVPRKVLSQDDLRVRAEKWLADHPDMIPVVGYLPEGEQHLTPVLADMHARLHQWGSLSDKQREFALKLYARKTAPAPVDEFEKVEAPMGRVTVAGVVCTVKGKDTVFGHVLKMLVKVTKGTGAFTVWVKACGTVERGDLVIFTATLTPDEKDNSHAWGSRPKEILTVHANPAVA